MTRHTQSGKKKQAARRKREVISYKENVGGEVQDLEATPDGLYDRARDEALCIICSQDGRFGYVFIPLLHQVMPKTYYTPVFQSSTPVLLSIPLALQILTAYIFLYGGLIGPGPPAMDSSFLKYIKEDQMAIVLCGPAVS
ncbi:hypothetical protein SELMODRAFT_403877 [Selaginella moellendorffii]|uniref:Uncharacterized protein n=1 Tax=Selaginella moellendorffii TaxID=88036 RepID=D8QSU6_SELML|nr:hypothetical protein SELMODRAFT_403877 [Selaginella moellendorffii]